MLSKFLVDVLKKFWGKLIKSLKEFSAKWFNLFLTNQTSFYFYTYLKISSRIFLVNSFEIDKTFFWEFLRKSTDNSFDFSKN